MRNCIKALILLLLGLYYTSAVSQSSQQLELKKKRKQIENEIKQINELLFLNNNKKLDAFFEIENLNIKIKRKEELVKLTNQQINIITKEINTKEAEKIITEFNKPNVDAEKSKTSSLAKNKTKSKKISKK